MGKLRPEMLRELARVNGKAWIWAQCLALGWALFHATSTRRRLQFIKEHLSLLPHACPVYCKPTQSTPPLASLSPGGWRQPWSTHTCAENDGLCSPGTMRSWAELGQSRVRIQTPPSSDHVSMGKDLCLSERPLPSKETGRKKNFFLKDPSAGSWESDEVTCQRQQHL